MLGDSGLCDAELCLDGLDDAPCRLLTTRKKLQDPSSNWVAENIERVHNKSP
jgi:hypothetical protein